MPAPYPGGCICGEVRYVLESEPLTLYACHCTDCQRRTGTAFALSLLALRSAQPWFQFPQDVPRFEAQPAPGELTRLWQQSTRMS